MVVIKPKKVVKIIPKHLSGVLTRNSAGLFRVQNRVIWAWFSTMAALVVLGPDKVVKNRSKHFSAILTTNDKNCTPNIVGMFKVQNQVIWARFSTLPAPGLLWGA